MGLEKRRLERAEFPLDAGRIDFFISIIGIFILVPALLFRFMALIERGFV